MKSNTRSGHIGLVHRMSTNMNMTQLKVQLLGGKTSWLFTNMVDLNQYKSYKSELKLNNHIQIQLFCKIQYGLLGITLPFEVCPDYAKTRGHRLKYRELSADVNAYKLSFFP